MSLTALLETESRTCSNKAVKRAFLPLKTKIVRYDAGVAAQLYIYAKNISSFRIGIKNNTYKTRDASDLLAARRSMIDKTNRDRKKECTLCWISVSLYAAKLSHREQQQSCKRTARSGKGGLQELEQSLKLSIVTQL